MKSMKNIKPAYAVKLGKGVFTAGVYTHWTCRNCGRTSQHMVPSLNNILPPDPRFGGVDCPDSSSGKHVWMRVD